MGVAARLAAGIKRVPPFDARHYLVLLVAWVRIGLTSGLVYETSEIPYLPQADLILARMA